MGLRELVVYGSICTTALVAGIYQGACSEKGIYIPTGPDVFMTYGLPLGSTLIGFVEGVTSNKNKCAADPFVYVGEAIGGAMGAAKGGLGAVVCGGVGFGLGSIGSIIV